MTEQTFDAAHQRLLKPSEEATAQVTGWLDLLDAQRERFRLTLDTHERIWCQWPDRLFPAVPFCGAGRSK